MLKKKKPSNKQNPKSKKIPQMTISSNFYTEQIRIPTNSSMDLKSFNKTIEIKKTSTLQTKKSISRKSTNHSIKPCVTLNSPNINRLLKDFKELKLIHENSSKSPKSCKSKSGKKTKSNKTSFRTLRSNTLTVKNGSLKLQKTLNKLNLTELFREELSQLPIASISQEVANQQQGKIVDIDNEEMIDLVQLRQFCSTATITQKKAFSRSFKNGDLFKENVAASKIQRAWKRYRTRRIVQRYIFYVKSRLSQRIQYQNSSNFSSDGQIHQMDLFSSDLYHQVKDQQGVRQISQLSNHEVEKKQQKQYQEQIQNIKHEQLNKWNQIIAIIRQADKKDPTDIQKLIATITQKSQINKKNLENYQQCVVKQEEIVFIPLTQQKVNDIAPPIIKQATKQKQIAKEVQKKNQNLSPQSKSQNSIQDNEEYNCRKYVNYLDCDIYPYQKESLSGTSQRRLEQIIQKTTISKKKQQILLDQLKNNHIPNHLGENKLYNSNSLISLNSIKSRQVEIHTFATSRNSLSKVNSEKILRSSLKYCADEQIQIEINDRQNLECEYLQSGQIIDEDTEPARHLKTDRSSQDDIDIQENQFIQISNEQGQNRQNNYNKHEHTFKRSNQPLDMYHDQKEVEQLGFFKMHSIQNEDFCQQHHQQIQQVGQALTYKTIQCQKQQKEPSDREQDIHDISILIFNSLVLECLKDISKSDALATSFKEYLKSIRPKIKRCENGVRKKGFPTDKKEIDSFLQCMISYLKTYEQKIFKNLEVPTGPSALEMLRYMHDSSQQESISACNDQDEANIMVIPNRIFQIFWQLKEKSIIVEVPANFNDTNFVVFKQNLDYLKNFNKIFYRSLFDTLNQCLDYSRNYGQFGRPFPWKRSPMFSHQLSQTKIESGIFSARKRMMDLATTYCGLIIQKQDLGQLGGGEEYITQVQEDRLSRMLANDLIDCEAKWVFYDDEQAEILIQLSDIIYRQIFKDFIEQLYLLI